MTREVAAGQVSPFLFGTSIATRLRAHAYTFLGLLGFVAFVVFVAAVLLSLLAFVPRAEVAYLLVAALVLVEALVLFRSRESATGRYAVVPIAILLLLVVHATTGRSQVAAGVASLLCFVTLVAGVSTFWTSQPTILRCIKCPQWSREVRAWQMGKSNRLAIWPYDGRTRWFVSLPHHPAPATAEPRSVVSRP